MSETLKTIIYILLVAILLFSPVYSEAHSQERFAPQQFTQDFDYLWSQLRDRYAYFDKKETDWNRVREIYRPKVADVRNMRECVTLLERVLDELYDPHTHLKINTNRSTRLIPTGLDVWAEWKNGKATITQLRKGFSAEQAGLKLSRHSGQVRGLEPSRNALRRRGEVKIVRPRGSGLIRILGARRDREARRD